MRHLEVSERGGEFVSVLVEGPDPRPKSGELLLRVAASGVNRADLSQIAGKYPPPAGESEILGLEASGTLETGEPACALLAGGGHAEMVTVAQGQVFPCPRGMGVVSAAAIPEAFLTAYLNLVIEAGLQKGEGLLVHAGGSGVGLAAIQTGRLLNARVAATTRTASKLAALIHAGADPAIDTSREPFPEAIERQWGKNSVNVVLDPVGADTLSRDLRLLATGGRIVFLATLSGARAELDIRQVMAKRARLIGSTLRARPRREKAEIVARFQRDILPAFDEGGLDLSIDTVFPPTEAAAAFARIRDNRNTGKILIDWTRLADRPAR